MSKKTLLVLIGLFSINVAMADYLLVAPGVQFPSLTVIHRFSYDTPCESNKARFEKAYPDRKEFKFSCVEFHERY